MSDIDELYSQKREYSSLRDNVLLTRNYLNKSIDKLNLVSSKVVDGYSIDGISGDDGYLLSTQEKIQSLYSYLNNTVLPSIDKTIRQINEEIETAEMANGQGDDSDD